MDPRPPAGESDRPPQLAPEASHPHFVLPERPPAAKSRAKTIAKRVGGAAALGATFVAAAVGGIVVHIGTPPARRLASAAVNQILTGTFRGKIEVVRLAGLHPDGIDGGVLTLTDPDGGQLALLEGVRARIALVPLLASLLSRGDMRIRVTDLSIDHIDVLIAQAPDGSLTIANAFQPAEAGPPPPPTKSGGLDLDLSRIALKHAWVHGGMSALPRIDADLDEVGASFGMTPTKTSVDVRSFRLATRGMPNGADVAANLEAHLVLPEDASEMSASARLAATVGGIDLRAAGGVERKQVDATLDMPQALPEQLNELLGGERIYQVVGAHAEAHGTLSELDPSVHLTVGSGTLDLHGHVTLPSDAEPNTLATVSLAARDLDLRAASATAAASKLGADVSATARVLAAGGVDGTYDVHVLPGAVGAQPTPDARVAGTFTPTHVRGAAHVSEPGMPSDVRFDVNPIAKDGPEIAFGASIQARDLAKVPLLHGAVRGRVLVRADGTIAVGSKQMTARVSSTLTGVDAGSVAVQQATVNAAGQGAFDAPSGLVTVDGQGLRAAGYSYPAFDVRAEGTSGEIRFGANLRGGDDPAVAATGTVQTKGPLSARDVSVTLAKDKDKVTARIASARSQGSQLDVEGIRLEGAGDPLEGELHLRGGTIATRLRGAGVDVPTLLRLAGIKTDVRQGRVGLDVDLQASKRATKGHANVAFRGFAYGETVSQLDANLRGTFDGEGAEVHLDLNDAAKDSLKLDTEKGHLAGGALDPHAWTNASGRVHGAVDVDLLALKKLAGGALPFDDLRGWLSAKIDLERDDPHRRPSAAVAVTTRGLVFTTEPQSIPNPDGTVTVVGRSFSSQGLDAKVNASMNADTGKSAIDAVVADHEGRLFEVKAGSTLPMNALLGNGSPREALLSTPMRVHFEVPNRSIGSVPALLASVPARGEVALMFDVEGTAKEPHLQALIHARNIVDAEDPTPVPISFDAAAFYDGAALRAKVIALQKDTQVLDLVTDVALRASDLIAGTLPWNASADVHLAKFPVGAVTGFFDENAIDASLSGSVALRDLHKAGQLDVNLDLADITINGTKFGDTKTTVKLREGSLDAEAQVKQIDGVADLHVTGGLGWGDALAPTVNEQKPVNVALEAKNFRIGMAAPFVRSVVSELDGRLNANTKLHILPGMKDGTMTGAILIDHGLFETVAIGEEMHNLRARIFMKPWGVWNVAEISADGTSGHFNANANLHLAGLHPQSGEAHLKIAQKDRLPLGMQGVELGTVWGQVDAKVGLSADDRTMNVDVAIPNLHVELPQSIAHGVQSTTADPTIKVGTIEPSGVVAILPVDGSGPPPAPPPPPKDEAATPPMKIHLATHLGPNFEVRRDTTVRAYVAGGPTIDLGEATTISGAIEIPRGYIELQGKRFQIDKGQLTFTGQPVDDPVVVATASYEAPDGTKVFADFVGPVKTGKLTLRSDPQLSQNEILALLLFGSADGTFGQSAPPGQQGNDMTEAASLAGGVVTQGLNKAISGVSGVNVQTKVNTQETGDPRPEVEVALSRDVSATVVYNLGVPPPGQNPDDTLLVVNWRFHRNYATEATIGDKGTSILDLTWKYRY